MTRSPYATKHPLLVLPVVVRKRSKLSKKLLKHQPPDFHMLENWNENGQVMVATLCGTLSVPTNIPDFQCLCNWKILTLTPARHLDMLCRCSSKQMSYLLVVQIKHTKLQRALYPKANCFYVNVVSTTFSTQSRAFWQIVHTAICSASSSELLIRISLS